MFNNNTVCYHHLVSASAPGRLDPRVDWCCTTTFDEIPRNCPNLNPADMRREVKTFDKRRSKGQLRDQVHSLYWWKVSRALDLGKLKAPSKQQYQAAALKFASFDPTADNMWQKVKMSSVVLKVKTTHDWVHVCRGEGKGWGRSRVSCDKLDQNVNVTGHNKRGGDILSSWLSTISMLEVFNCQENSILQVHKQ